MLDFLYLIIEITKYKEQLCMLVFTFLLFFIITGDIKSVTKALLKITLAYTIFISFI